jgi:hypothetical protein
MCITILPWVPLGQALGWLVNSVQCSAVQCSAVVRAAANYIDLLANQARHDTPQSAL